MISRFAQQLSPGSVAGLLVWLCLVGPLAAITERPPPGLRAASRPRVIAVLDLAPTFKVISCEGRSTLSADADANKWTCRWTPLLQQRLLIISFGISTTLRGYSNANPS